MFGRNRVTAFLAVAVLAALAAAAIIPADVSDADSPTISIQELEAAPNKDVTLDVYISDNPGISEIQIHFLIPQGLDITNVTSDLMNIQDQGLSGNFYIVDAVSGSTVTQDGTLMTLHIHTPDRDPNAVYHIYPYEIESSPSATFEKVRGTINLDLPGAIGDSSGDGNHDNYEIIGAAIIALLVLAVAALIVMSRR